MKPMKHNVPTPPGDSFDHVLDAALSKYAAVEPRVGLEDRVLAHLHSEPSQSSRRIWLRWELAGAVAAIVILAVLASRSNRVTHPVIANHPPAAIQQPSIQGTKPAPPSNDIVAVVQHPSTRKFVARRAPAPPAFVPPPKLDQFPSPQPLSTEEIALAHYVKSFPREAQLVAKAQEEFAIETQNIMNDGGSQAQPSSSIQQER